MEKKRTNKKNTTLVQREDMSSANMSFRQTINSLLYVTYPGEKMKSTTLVMKMKKKESFLMAVTFFISVYCSNNFRRGRRQKRPSTIKKFRLQIWHSS